MQKRANVKSRETIVHSSPFDVTGVIKFHLKKGERRNLPSAKGSEFYIEKPKVCLKDVT